MIYVDCQEIRWLERSRETTFQPDLLINVRERKRDGRERLDERTVESKIEEKRKKLRVMELQGLKFSTRTL